MSDPTYIEETTVFEWGFYPFTLQFPSYTGLALLLFVKFAAAAAIVYDAQHR